MPLHTRSTYDIVWREAMMELLDQLEAENPEDPTLAPKVCTGFRLDCREQHGRGPVGGPDAARAQPRRGLAPSIPLEVFLLTPEHIHAIGRP